MDFGTGLRLLKKGLSVGNGPGAFEWVWANLKVDGQVKGPLIISSLDLGFISSPRLPTRRPKLIHHEIGLGFHPKPKSTIINL